jgi:DNA-binding response OmpR family regulator
MPPNVLNRIKIFLIENHDNLRSVLAGFLEAQGAKVFTYPVATDVMADLTSESPDLVLLDLSGAEVAGFQLLEQIRTFDWESGGDTPVLAIGRLATIVGHRRASLAGFCSYLEMPFSPNQLMHAIKSALNLQG